MGEQTHCTKHDKQQFGSVTKDSLSDMALHSESLTAVFLCHDLHTKWRDGSPLDTNRVGNEIITIRSSQ